MNSFIYQRVSSTTGLVLSSPNLILLKFSTVFACFRTYYQAASTFSPNDIEWSESDCCRFGYGDYAML